MSADSVLSAKMEEDLKPLLTGVRQISQGEDPPIIYLPDEDSRTTIGHHPFRSIAEWKHAQEWDEVVVRRLSLYPTKGKERGRLKTLLRVWKVLGAPERNLLDLHGLTAWTVNPKIRIMRAEVGMGASPGDLHLWCGKAKKGKVHDQLQLLHMPAKWRDRAWDSGN